MSGDGYRSWPSWLASEFEEPESSINLPPSSSVSMHVGGPAAVAGYSYLFNFPLAVSTVNYFALASNLGNTPVLTTMRREGTRAIWYTRYIDWIITTPMLLLALLLATGLPLGDITAILACKLWHFPAKSLPLTPSC